MRNGMNRRQFFMTGAALSASLAGTRWAASHTGDHPNIVWIIGDDLGVELGCYGDEVVQTPNCDRLAAEGMRCDGAFATSPVCSPSRSAFITGMYQTAIGAHHHRTRDKQPLPGAIKTLPRLLRSKGYFCANGDGTPNSKPAKTDYNFRGGYLYDGTDWSQRVKADQPFFAQVQIYEPHRPFRQDQERPVDPERVKLPPYYPDHPVARKDWALYLESVQVFDRKVGAVLKRLDDEGLAENTVVMLFGDHGRPHVRDKQWLYDPGIRAPLMIRWPKRIRPGTVNANLISLIDLAPTCLTIAGVEIPNWMQGESMLDGERREHIFAARDRAGDAFERVRCVRTKRFKYIRNFRPELPWNQFSGYKRLGYPMIALLEALHEDGKLTPDQARYLDPNKPPEELYDLRIDPHELNNLSENKEYSKTLIELRGLLDRWERSTMDQGRTPESAEELEALIRSKREGYHDKTMRRRGLDPNIGAKDYLQWWQAKLGVTEETQ